MSDASYLPVARMITPRRGPDRQARPELTSAELGVRAFFQTLIKQRHEGRTGHVSTFLDDHVPAWDGGHDAATGRYYAEPFWRRFLAACQSNGVDAVAYLRWRLQTWNGADIPAPRDFERNYAFAEFKQRVPEAEFARTVFQAARDAFDQSVYHYRTCYQYSELAAKRAALHCKRARFGPLFVYCVATAHGFVDEASSTFAAAVTEYVGDRALIDSIWGDFIPADIRRVPSESLLAAVQGLRT